MELFRLLPSIKGFEVEWVYEKTGVDDSRRDDF
ncbi:MAG: hypothetical protein UY26_C0003G0179 [Candidatus Jorgensenbacteria bacterium GW2011_GWA1_48_13]|uniref:Uncharacterized protein n=1 Tax=Candidatus Jorgensenbacteria bacterium GW2011_GWB1_50_10 TaxID=1618665 RepID=A0A0G1W991_9BACT|nr:MAG: hypothetical protein UY26_C0003G0179 [Candidatus Jorgensenbacteria bacterium GW2011_GWA1_48_13]KKW15135.1 MAG: hypothetical protein UY55_C0002G0193 [Candidatus Jorgensenbacteria bacterium GW2011_GWB1_50_10]